MDAIVKERPFRLQGAFRFTPLKPLNQLIEATAERLLALDKLDRLYCGLPNAPDACGFAGQVLELFNIRYHIDGDQATRIPPKGPTVLVANHPFGAIEGMVMAHLLLSIRSDVRILANRFLHRIPELRELFLSVDVFGGKDSVKSNAKAMRDAIRWVRNGGLLLVFPAGEVSHLHLKERSIIDPPWQPMIGRLVRLTRAPVVPLHIAGSNGPAFQLLGMVHPRLRTALLPRELANKGHRTIQLRAGQSIHAQRLTQFKDDEQCIRYLRLKTYMLGSAAARTPQTSTATTPPGEPAHQPLAPARDPRRLRAEIVRLPENHCLVENGDMAVYTAYAEQVPEVLQELGRLRELTFRETGEGTGRSADIDLYDSYYLHLFVWNHAKNQLVGAYRLGEVDAIVRRIGRKGLYTQTLFRYKQQLLERLGPAIELGRSFVRPEYQRSHSPLMLLWRGIGEFVSRNPRYCILFGPVSISSEYQTLSRQMLVDFLKAHRYATDLARMVKPRRPFACKLSHQPPFSDWHELDDMQRLSELIADIEPDHKGIPILLRQYLKLGGRLLGFNIDPDFSDVLDGLIMVDLRQTDRRMLARYMTPTGAERFLKHHGRGSDHGKCLIDNRIVV